MYRLLLLAAVAAALAIAAVSILILIARVIGVRIRGRAPGRCRNCGGADIRPSFPSGLRDPFFALFACVPFRCRACSYRFYRVK